MKIPVDYDIDATGYISGIHVLNSADPLSLNALTAARASVAALNASGWAVQSKHPLYPNNTRMQVIMGEAVRLNDAPLRQTLGV